MNNLFKNEIKIKLYSKIQKGLHNLKSNASDDEIREIFTILPSNFFDEKDNLIMICQLFGMVGRYRRPMGRVVIKLFESILNIIKRDLQNESSIIWSFFGGCFYFKLWMYKEGLIDMEQIILASQNDNSSKTAEYFLPEIIQYDRELFEKEIKHKFPIFSSEESYSQESIQKLISLREKHFIWLKESGDFSHESYREIEKDPIRYAIKTDDISSFQTLLSQSNLSIDSTIQESIIENFLRVQTELHIIEYTINYNSIKIFKFLMMNGAKLNLNVIDYAIHSNNYDIIHIVESAMKEEFNKTAIRFAIISWNQNLIQYILDNCNLDFLFESEIQNQEENNKNQNVNENQEENIKNENKQKENNENPNKNDNDENNDDNNEEDENNKTPKDKLILLMIENSIFSYNFKFFKSILLPYLRNNPSFSQKFINDIIMMSFSDMSYYFPGEFIQYPGVDINYVSPDHRTTFLLLAVEQNNSRAVEQLLKIPNIDVNGQAHYSPLFYSCASFKSMKIVKMISQHPNVDINFREPEFNDSSFQISMITGNVYAMKYLIQTFPNIVVDNFCEDSYFCVHYNHFMTLKIFIKYFMDKYEIGRFDSLIELCKDYILNQSQNSLLVQIFTDIVDELQNK